MSLYQNCNFLPLKRTEARDCVTNRAQPLKPNIIGSACQSDSHYRVFQNSKFCAGIIPSNEKCLSTNLSVLSFPYLGSRGMELQTVISSSTSLDFSVATNSCLASVPELVCTIIKLKRSYDENPLIFKRHSKFYTFLSIFGTKRDSETSWVPPQSIAFSDHKFYQSRIQPLLSFSPCFR